MMKSLVLRRRKSEMKLSNFFADFEYPENEIEREREGEGREGARVLRHFGYGTSCSLGELQSRAFVPHAFRLCDATVLRRARLF